MRKSLDSLLASKGREVHSIGPEATVLEAVRTMNAQKIGALLICDGSDVLGIFTERDVTMRVAGQVADLTKAHVADYMTAEPITVTGDLPLAQALHLVSVHGFRHLPLVDEEGRPREIISSRDIINYLTSLVLGIS